MSPVIFRGSRVGMLRKISSQVLETRCGGVEEHQPRRIRKRNRIGPYRESEGFKVPFEDRDNTTLSEGRDPALFTQPKSGGKEIAEMLTTPETIRTLQRKLYRKAKQEPACRFHSLYDKYTGKPVSRCRTRSFKRSAGCW